MAKSDLIEATYTGDLKRFVDNFESQYLNMDDFSCKATLLHMVVDGRSVDIVRFLVEQGADLNKRAGVYGANPVTYAADEGKLEVVKVLVAV